MHHWPRFAHPKPMRQRQKRWLEQNSFSPKHHRLIRCKPRHQNQWLYQCHHHRWPQPNCRWHSHWHPMQWLGRLMRWFCNRWRWLGYCHRRLLCLNKHRPRWSIWWAHRLDPILDPWRCLSCRWQRFGRFYCLLCCNWCKTDWYCHHLLHKPLLAGQRPISPSRQWPWPLCSFLLLF